MARPRNSGFAADVTHNGKRYRAAGFTTLVAAQAWEYQAMANLLVGKQPPPSPADGEDHKTWGLKDMLDFAFREHWSKSDSPEYFTKTMRTVIEDLGPDYPAIDLCSAAGYDRILDACKARGNSNSTINGKASLVSKGLKIAIEKGKLQGVLKPQYPRLPPGAGRERIITLDEEAAALAWLRQCTPDLADWFILCIDCGPRVYSEALHVYPHVDIRGNGILIRGRNLGANVSIIGAERRTKAGRGKSRVVGMTSRVAAMIERRKAKLGREDALFSGTDLEKYRIIDLWARMRADLRIDDPEFVPYSLRHTFGTRMILAGNSVPATSDAMGHSTIRQTWKYVHLAGQMSEQAASNLDAWLKR